MNENDRNHSWLARGSTDSTDVAHYYDEWADSYDTSLEEWGYEAPVQAASLLGKHVPGDARLLDAGCGTGLTGRALQQAGYAHVDGMDISRASLRLAEATGAYRRLMEQDLQQPLAAETDAYDALQCIGVLTYIADPETLLREFCRVVRPGGWVLFSQRSDLFESMGFPGLLRGLEEEGLWTPLETTEPKPYLPNNEDFADRTLVLYCLFRVR